MSADRHTTPDTRTTPDSRIKLQLICQTAAQAKAHDIVVLDVRRQTIVADFFVVCSGTSTTHIKSVAEEVQERLRESRIRGHVEGEAGSYWIILDYNDVIVHIFDEATREFYDLERLWADAVLVKFAEEDTDLLQLLEQHVHEGISPEPA